MKAIVSCSRPCYRAARTNPLALTLVSEYSCLVGERMNRLRRVGACVLSCMVLVPSMALAQASLAGVVRDASGAVLPGATVEASSPVLIEKVRSITTDGTGRYTIADLRPGTYSVTFSLAGFRTVVREGVELAGTAVLTVNAELSVGGVQETIT